MISKKDALKLGIAVVDAVKAEMLSGAGPTDPAVLAARGVGVRAMDSIWSGMLPDRVREQFNWSRMDFMVACGWPT